MRGGYTLSPPLVGYPLSLATAQDYLFGLCHSLRLTGDGSPYLLGCFICLCLVPFRWTTTATRTANDCCCSGTSYLLLLTYYFSFAFAICCAAHSSIEKHTFFPGTSAYLPLHSRSKCAKSFSGTPEVSNPCQEDDNLQNVQGKKSVKIV